MGVRGMDISNHQAGMDVERVVRENNIGFVFVLSNDGTFKNIYYRAQMDAARRGGAIAVPYVYLRTNVDQTYATFRQQEPTRGPAIVDVEDGSGGRFECDRMHSLLHSGGYTTPLLYWPDWYRKKVGSPSLAGLPPLWTSWYPDYVNRGFDQGLAMVPAWLWNGYGGLPTRIVQFTSSGRLSGYGGNLDLNYFPGTRAELAALLGGQEEDPMPTPKELWDAEIVNDADGQPGQAKKWLIDTNAHAYHALNEVRAMRREMQAGFKDLSDDEMNIVTAVRAMPTGGQVDVEDLANRLRGALGDAVADRLAERLTSKESA